MQGNLRVCGAYSNGTKSLESIKSQESSYLPSNCSLRACYHTPHCRVAFARAMSCSTIDTRAMTKTTTDRDDCGLTLKRSHRARADRSQCVREHRAGGQLQSHDFHGEHVPALQRNRRSTPIRRWEQVFVFDASVGYRVWRRLSVAVGVSTFSGSGAATSSFRPRSVDLRQARRQNDPASDYGDLSQRTRRSISRPFGPAAHRQARSWLSRWSSVIHVTQDAAWRRNPGRDHHGQKLPRARASAVGVDPATG